ncbi:NodZ family protein [Primorskyibacter sp. 2E107]|uniref:NodZ family protein n=1 Tax=Primorskyibacter sp. 2E107 TaxID=3403458 RepID=UPI003AF59B4C
MDKTLIIKAKGGLGNRMLSAVCGLIFADLTGRAPIIDWRDGSYAPEGVNAYPLLFDTPIDTPIEAFDDHPGPVNPPVWQGDLDKSPTDLIDRLDPALHSGARVYRRFCTDLTRLHAPEDLAVFWCYLPKFGRLASHLRRDARFRGRSEDSLLQEYLARYFTPNRRVREAVEAYRARFGRPLIGVHVRYTDRKIPVEPLEAALDKALAKKPGARIFLATDNIEIQKRFAERYGDIHFTDKYLPEDGARLHLPQAEIEKQREAENALIDIHLLAGCDHLICSRHSTFAETAILIGSLRDRMQDVDRFNPAVVSKRIVQRYI